VCVCDTNVTFDAGVVHCWKLSQGRRLCKLQLQSILADISIGLRSSELLQ